MQGARIVLFIAPRAILILLFGFALWVMTPAVPSLPAIPGAWLMPAQPLPAFKLEQHNERAEVTPDSLIQASVTQDEPGSVQVTPGLTLFLINEEGRSQAVLEPTRTLTGRLHFEPGRLLQDYQTVRRSANTHQLYR